MSVLPMRGAPAPGPIEPEITLRQVVCRTSAVWPGLTSEDSRPCNIGALACRLLEDRTIEQEHALAIYLNVEGVPIGYHHVGTGTMDQVLAAPRDILRDAIRLNAAGVIFIHTHPAGTEPSLEDERHAWNVLQAATLLGFHLAPCAVLNRETGEIQEVMPRPPDWWPSR